MNVFTRLIEFGWVLNRENLKEMIYVCVFRYFPNEETRRTTKACEFQLSTFCPDWSYSDKDTCHCVSDLIHDITHILYVSKRHTRKKINEKNYIYQSMFKTEASNDAVEEIIIPHVQFLHTKIIIQHFIVLYYKFLKICMHIQFNIFFIF